MPINRRHFIELTASASTALLLSSLDTFSATNKPAFTMDNKFELKIMGTNWGFTGTVDEFCAKAKQEGYDGIEMWWPLNKKDQDELFAGLKKHQLDVGFLCGGSQDNPAEHLEVFKKMIDAA